MKCISLIFLFKLSVDTEGIVDQDDKNAFVLFYYYSSIFVEERTETLIYDVIGVLAAAGGHLGLCLGFSCLTLLLSFIECIELKFKRVINPNEH